jgi:hypothetical protein
MIQRDTLINSTPLRAGEELRVTLSPYRGQCYLHARRYYRDGEVWKPGKGLAVRVDMLPWLLAALHTTEAEALRSGLLFPEDYENAGLPAPEEAA